jgi:hypothetical protein
VMIFCKMPMKHYIKRHRINFSETLFALTSTGAAFWQSLLFFSIS